MNTQEHFNKPQLLAHLKHHQPMLERVLGYAASHLEHYPAKLQDAVRSRDLGAIKANAAYLRQTAASCALPTLEEKARELGELHYFDRAQIQAIERAIQQEINLVLPLLKN